MRFRPRTLSAAVALLSAALAIAASWGGSATTDEPYHLLAAHAHFTEGLYDLNPEHPPLAKLLAGAALAPLRLRGTQAPPVARLGVLPEETRRFLYGNRVPAPTLLRVARLPLVVFLLALLWGVHAWARELWGEGAAPLAVAAVGLQPLVLGHALLVHTDVAAAACWTWTLLWLHRWLRGRTLGWLGLGAWLGLAALAKHSAPYLALFVLLLVLLDARRSRSARKAGLVLASFAVALAVTVAGYAPALRRTTPALAEATIRAHAARWPGTERAADALVALSRVSPAVAHVGIGLLHVHETNRSGQGVNVFFGRTSQEGFALYFPAAFLLKVSFPFLLLLGAGAVSLRRQRAGPDDAVLLVPVALFFLSSVGTTYNIGARHLLPVLPPLAVFGVRGAASMAKRVRLGLGAAFAASAALAFPHYISHFSLLAPGAASGTLLNDSNLDWGQDWARLGREAPGQGWSPLTTVQVGTAFPAYWLPGSRDYLVDGLVPAPGYYAVSSFAFVAGPPYLERLGEARGADRLRALLARLEREGTLVGGAGTSLAVYRLPGNGPL